MHLTARIHFCIPTNTNVDEHNMADRLNVIALISGGKDSFFGLLHCIQNGHNVVALANLFPALDGDTSTETQVIEPTMNQKPLERDSTEPDLNSFMYQTVGHEIIPLYAAATGLPLYRQPILGGAERHERDYAFNDNASTKDETESMTNLLKTILKSHPEANAICAGAILSTYQRTRVESVALRLGLAPLAYLWKYPVLPQPALPTDDSQLLKDMEEAGLDARIIKVASAGLTEAQLWQRVSSTAGAEAVKLALRKFGAAGGAVVGEGGEFETIVIDGPSPLFKRRIRVPASGRKVVNEGGGSTWLMLREASLEDKDPQPEDRNVRVPHILEGRFNAIVRELSERPAQGPKVATAKSLEYPSLLGRVERATASDRALLHWAVVPTMKHDSIEDETSELVQQIRELLAVTSTTPEQISNTVVFLRNMADFPKVNALYGQLFSNPKPPSRVTVSCGELLPPSGSIAIYLTIDISGGHREGLHVQSRSYWAPANIGPYSQAIGTSIVHQGNDTGLQSWSVAGQIPLIPSSMLLPSKSPTSQEMQLVLSLQHLWRIGVDMHIQLWTSAVALFARTSSRDLMQKNAVQAGAAWRIAHGSPDDEDEEDAGLDPWDLKYNSQHMSLAGGDQSSAPTPLPDWSIFTLRQQNEPETCVPPVFAVEVEELPKQADIEWHAHIGLSRVSESSVEMLHHQRLEVGGWQAWNTVARGDNGVYIHTTIACDLDCAHGNEDDIQRAMGTARRASLKKLKVYDEGDAKMPYLIYADGTKNLDIKSGGLPVLPCHSLWSCEGERLGIIGLYRTTVDL